MTDGILSLLMIVVPAGAACLGIWLILGVGRDRAVRRAGGEEAAELTIKPMSDVVTPSTLTPHEERTLAHRKTFRDVLRIVEAMPGIEDPGTVTIDAIRTCLGERFMTYDEAEDERPS